MQDLFSWYLYFINILNDDGHNNNSNTKLYMQRKISKQTTKLKHDKNKKK